MRIQIQLHIVFNIQQVPCNVLCRIKDSDPHSLNGNQDKAFSETFIRRPNSMVQNEEFGKKGRENHE